MLAAPFLLTIALGAITGSFSQNSAVLQNIPIIIVNQDEGEMGKILQQALNEDLGGLFSVAETQNPAEARRQVEQDQVAAVLVIPKSFSLGLSLPESQIGMNQDITIQLYANPARPISVSVLESIIQGMISEMETIPAAITLSIQEMVQTGIIKPDQAQETGKELSVNFLEQVNNKGWINAISVRTEESETEEEFNYLAYLAPGMAVFFLMYTVTQGGRSILAEREMGTFGRMLTTPTTSGQILSGKIVGIFTTGFFQVSILVVVSSLIFRLNWGQPLAVIILILAVCLAATGWGILLAGLARDSYQVGGLGSAMMLIFGILGGTFMPTSQFSDLVQTLAKVTPNYWAMEGFAVLAAGGDFTAILPILGALLIMTAILFGVTLVMTRRSWSNIGYLKP